MKTDEEGNGSRERRGGKSHMTDFTMEQMSKTLKSLNYLGMRVLGEFINPHNLFYVYNAEIVVKYLNTLNAWTVKRYCNHLVRFLMWGEGDEDIDPKLLNVIASYRPPEAPPRTTEYTVLRDSLIKWYRLATSCAQHTLHRSRTDRTAEDVEKMERASRVYDNIEALMKGVETKGNVQTVYIPSDRNLWDRVLQTYDELHGQLDRRCTTSRSKSVLAKEIDRIIAMECINIRRETGEVRTKYFDTYRGYSSVMRQIVNWFNECIFEQYVRSPGLREQGEDPPYIYSLACLLRWDRLVFYESYLRNQKNRLSIRTSKAWYSVVTWFLRRLNYLDNHNFSPLLLNPIYQEYKNNWYNKLPKETFTKKKFDTLNHTWLSTVAKVRELIDTGEIDDPIDVLLLELYTTLPMRRSKDYTGMVMNPDPKYSSDSPEYADILQYKDEPKDMRWDKFFNPRCTNTFLFHWNEGNVRNDERGKFLYKRWKLARKEHIKNQECVLLNTNRRLVRAIEKRFQGNYRNETKRWLLMRTDGTQHRVEMDNTQVTMRLADLQKRYRVPVTINKMRHLYASYMCSDPVYRLYRKHFNDNRVAYEDKVAKMMGTSLKMLNEHYKIDGYRENMYGNQPPVFQVNEQLEYLNWLVVKEKPSDFAIEVEDEDDDLGEILIDEQEEDKLAGQPVDEEDIVVIDEDDSDNDSSMMKVPPSSSDATVADAVQPKDGRKRKRVPLLSNEVFQKAKSDGWPKLPERITAGDMPVDSEPLSVMDAITMEANGDDYAAQPKQRKRGRPKGSKNKNSKKSA